MKKLFPLLLLLALANSVKAQQWSLYNTGTMFDAFENPAQRTFIPDSSRRIAFNFFIPNGGVSYAGKGPAEKTIRQLFYLGPLATKELDNNNTTYNKIFADVNTYIAMLRIFKTVQYNREIGLSWQFRTEANYGITNQSFTTFQNPVIGDKISYNNTLNDYGTTQMYHQLSLSYRENYNRRLAFGAKLSYLSGVFYSKIKITNSEINIDKETNTFITNLQGSYRSNFIIDDFKHIFDDPWHYKRTFVPFIDNPGAAITAGFNYKTLRGLTIIGNIKDLGFIHWGRKAYTYRMNGTFAVDATDTSKIAANLSKEIKDKVFDDPSYEKFSSLIDGKAQVLFSKSYNNYQPNLILSKSLFNNRGNVVLVNNYNYRNWKFSLSSGYSTYGIVDIGGQFLYKSANAEFFLGSDRILKTITLARGTASMQADLADRHQDMPVQGSGYTGAAVYFGFGLKFGRVLYRWQNSSEIPGIEHFPSTIKKSKKKGVSGFFRRGS